MRSKWFGGKAKNSTREFRLLFSLPVGDLLDHVTPSASTRPTRIWKYDISPLGCVQTDRVVRVSLSHHQSLTDLYAQNKYNSNLAWQARSRVLYGLIETESLYYFSIGAMFILQDLSLTL